VESLTSDPKFKGSNPAAEGNERKLLRIQKLFEEGTIKNLKKLNFLTFLS
jgi:hypothetical protein